MQIEGWDKEKVTGVFCKTYTVMLRAADLGTAETNSHVGWAAGTQDRHCARAMLETTMSAQAKAAGYTKGGDNWRQHHFLARADVPVPKAWYDALIPGLTSILEMQLSCAAQETLQCIALFVQASWQAKPIKALMYGDAFVNKQLPGVQQVMQSSEYKHFAEKVREAELDSMTNLGLTLACLDPLTQWGQDRAALNDTSPSLPQSQITPLAASSCTALQPPAKRQKVQSSEVDGQTGSTLEQEQKQLAELQEAIKCERIAVQRAEMIAEWVREKAARIAAIEQRSKEVKEQTPVAPTHLAAAQDLGQSTIISAPLQLPSHSDLTGAGPTQDTDACLSAEQKATQPKKKVLLFKGQSVHKVWPMEWTHGGDHVSIKSKLQSNRRDGQQRLGLRGLNVARSMTSELQKKRHLPEAIEDVISETGLSEEVAVQLVDKLLFEFGMVTMPSKFDAFYKRNQMKKEEENSGQSGKAAELVDKKNPSMNVKAFDEAFKQAADHVAQLV